MGEKRDRTGKQVRPKTAVRGKRYLCSRCRKRSPRPVTTSAPWYCPNCLQEKTALNPMKALFLRDRQTRLAWHA
jgi:late competence protein required for DNA uptake (superfamily II DNA/RNA helicase)